MHQAQHREHDDRDAASTTGASFASMTTLVHGLLEVEGVDHPDVVDEDEQRAEQQGDGEERLPASIAPSAMYHLHMNPAVGGNPTIEIAPMAIAAEVMRHRFADAA